MVQYNLQAAVYTEQRENDAVSVYVGNVLFSLDVGNASTYSAAHAFYDAHSSGLTNLPYDQIKDWFFWNDCTSADM